MSAQFAVMTSHLAEPRKPVKGSGKLVFSDLPPGTSTLGSPAPSLKLVIEGEEIYRIDGRSVCVAPGEFLYLDAGAECLATNRQRTVGLCLTVPPGEEPAGEHEPLAGWDPVLGRALVLSARTSAMGHALEQCAARIARDPGLGSRLAPDLITRVSSALAEPLHASRAAIEGLKAAKASTRRELYQRLERARGYLHDNPTKALSLAELSRVAGLSRFHLARYFKMAFGQSPIAYHRQLRLAEAARIVRENGLSLAEVAELTGYSDPVALSHAFRRHYGSAPRQWSAKQD